MKKSYAELKKQGYRIVGKHSAVKICAWTKKSLNEEGVCYKEKFYGIKSHRCVQMSCSLFNCQNRCVHCWRNLKYTTQGAIKNPDSAKQIIKNCIREQRTILQGFRSNEKTKKQKLEEAMNPTQFAISLTGEATLYPKLDELIKELKKMKITSFLVTNGLEPNVLKKLEKKKALPTQLYISLNSPNKKMYEKWHHSSAKNAWKKFNQSLKIMKKLGKKTRTAIRITIVKGMNMIEEENYAKLIRKAAPDFVEIKAFMSVGDARKRIAYEKMPLFPEVKEFAEKINKHLNYTLAGESKESRVVLLSKEEKKMKIKSD